MQRFTLALLCLIAVPPLQERLHQDRIFQDHGLQTADCFQNTSSNTVETAMVHKVLDELDAAKIDTKSLRNEAAGLQTDYG